MRIILSIKNLFFLALITTSNGFLFGQLNTRIGTLPSINLNKALGKAWEYNTRIESRQFIYQKRVGQAAERKAVYELTDVTTLFGKKIGLDAKLVGGAMLRLSNKQVGLRLLQQYIFITQINKYTLAQRIAMDQTFEPQEKNEYRLRYRIGSQFALKGDKIDSKEFYFKINNEYIGSLQNGETDLEIRLTPFIGYVFNKNNKIELGLDNRLNQFSGSTKRFTSFFSINWYLKI